jgi:hypothetical protein
VVSMCIYICIHVYQCIYAFGNLQNK